MSKLTYDYETNSYPDEKYKNLYKQCEEDIDCINKIQKNMMEYIYGQKEKLLRIEDNMSVVNEITETTNKDLKDISNYTTTYTPIIRRINRRNNNITIIFNCWRTIWNTYINSWNIIWWFNGI